MTLRPYSTTFAEHYWSPAGGVMEKTTVFLEGNQLPSRLAALKNHQTFAVAELGLGTGLNFALTAQLFANTAPTTAILCYLGYEAHPLPLAELQAIHAQLPATLQPWLAELAIVWRNLKSGWNTHHVGPCRLHLYYGEAMVGLPNQPYKADAWYLDGFSPAKNPDLWSLPLCHQLAAQSNPGATVATYSIARSVRDNLIAAGFAVQKRAGVPPKRDRLEGLLKG